MRIRRLLRRNRHIGRIAVYPPLTMKSSDRNKLAVARRHKLEIVEGVGGLAVYLNDVRITGRETKPLGGGKTVATMVVDQKSIGEALKR